MTDIPYGFWTTDAPLTPEMVEADQAIVRGVVIPEGVHLNSAELYVNGRLWKWERFAVDFGSIRRDAT
jgi:hypothetical protein